MSGSAKFTAELEGGPQAILRLVNVGQVMEREHQRTVREVGEDAELIFAAHALRDTGRLARGIRSRAAGKNALVTAHAREPKSGYDYVGVTRFGHRASVIHGRPILGGRNARFTTKYRGFIARRVKGFKPSEDWAERAHPEIRVAANAAMRELGRRIEAQT